MEDSLLVRQLDFLKISFKKCFHPQFCFGKLLSLQKGGEYC